MCRGVSRSRATLSTPTKIDMSLPAPTIEDDLEATDKLDATLLTSKPSTGEDDDPAALEGTVSIELNFKAFADHVPATGHAKRVASHLDPSIQDFADQALELATLRAEVMRLTRDYDAVVRTLQRRDQHFQALRDEVSNTRAQLRDATKQLSEARSAQFPTAPVLPIAEPSPATPAVQTVHIVERTCASPIVRGPDVAAPACAAPTLQATDAPPQTVPTVELPAIPVSDPNEATARLLEEMHSATIAEPLPVVPKISAPLLASARRLQPLDHDGAPIVLDRDILTIGRTKKSDVCIASAAISRDHARLLVTRNSVTIIDMDSGNGCFVNAERVNKCRLREGDVLTIGDRSYRLVHGAAPEEV